MYNKMKKKKSMKNSSTHYCTKQAFEKEFLLKIKGSLLTTAHMKQLEKLAVKETWFIHAAVIMLQTPLSCLIWDDLYTSVWFIMYVRNKILAIELVYTDSQRWCKIRYVPICKQQRHIQSKKATRLFWLGRPEGHWALRPYGMVTGSQRNAPVLGFIITGSAIVSPENQQMQGQAEAKKLLS